MTKEIQKTLEADEAKSDPVTFASGAVASHEEFAHLEQCIKNPKGPSSTILEGAALLQELRTNMIEIGNLRHDIERHIEITTKQQVEIERMRGTLEQILAQKYCSSNFSQKYRNIIKIVEKSLKQEFVDKQCTDEQRMPKDNR